MRATKTDVPVAMEMPGFSSRQTEWGDLNVAFEAIAGGMDATDMFAKLPDGRCQCPHWGYVAEGPPSRQVRRPRRGDLGRRRLLPGAGPHPRVEEDLEVIEFSPLGEYQKTMAALEG